MKPLSDPGGQLSRIVIKGFKSIASCDLELSALNILIGSNGAGKSNFIQLFRMVQQIMEENLRMFVSRHGGPDAILHFGRKTTERLEVEFHLGPNGYGATLQPTLDNRLTFDTEKFWWADEDDRLYTKDLGRGHFETKLIELFLDFYFPGTKWLFLEPFRRWQAYHFQDTSETAYVKQRHPINDNFYFRSDGGNLAAYLYLLQRKHPDSYQRIVKIIRLVAPFFGDFLLRPAPLDEETTELEWFEQGRDVPFKAHHLSDGTLRFICLATVFLQPPELQPETIVVDEPELGLHPYAITVLASLIKAASREKQVIVSTQSVELLNEFDAEDVVVVDRENGKSIFKRLEQDKLKDWLEEYSLGELWKKNVIGGRPAR